MEIKEKSRNLLIVLLPLLLLVVLFLPSLTGGQTLFFRDLTKFDYPMTMYVVKSFKEGIFPLWNPYVFSGVPQMAAIQPPLFYPTTYLFLLMPFHLALTLSLILHYYLAGLGLYLLCRYWNLSRQSALFGALIFSLNGYMIDLNNLYYLVLAIAWVPLIFLGTERLIDRPGLKNFLILVLFLSMQLATGRLDYFYFTYLFVIGPWVIFRLARKSVKLSSGVFLFLATAFSLLIVSVQILPSLEFILYSSRSEGFTIQEAAKWSLHFSQLIHLVVSNFLGDLSQGKEVSGIISEKGEYFNFIHNLYLGTIAFSFFFLAFQDKNKRFIFFGSMLLLICLISLGLNSYIPIYSLLYKYLPGFFILRYPIKIFIFVVFYFCLIAAYGFEIFNRTNSVSDSNSRNENKSELNLIKISCGVFICLLLGLVIAYRTEDQITNYLNENYLDKSQETVSNLFPSLKRLAFELLGLGLFISLLIFYRSKKLNKNLLIIAIIALISCRFIQTGWVNLWFVEEKMLTEKPELASLLEKYLGESGLYTYYQLGNKISRELTLRPAVNDLYQTKKTLNYNEALLYRLYKINGYMASPPMKIFKIHTVITLNMLSDSEKAKLFRMMGVKIVVLLNGTNINRASLDYRYFDLLHVNMISGWKVYRLKISQPRFTYKKTALVTEEEEKIPVGLFNQEKLKINSDQLVFILKDRNYDKALSEVKNTADPEIRKEEIKFVGENANTLELSVRIPESGYLVIANTYDPGWQAFVNGKKYPVLKANYYQMALRLPPGNHQVRLEYYPYSFKVAKRISLVSLLLMVLLSALVVMRQERGR